MLNSIARPFGMVLMFLYDLVQNYGVSIIFFALVIKIILLPFQMKSKRGMMRQQRLQPKINELQKKYGTNRAKLNEETQKLYKEEGINPASGCLWGFLPLPIMLALYQVIRQPLTIMMGVAADLLADGGAISNLLTNLGFTSTVQNYYVEISKSQFISKHFDQFAGLSASLRQIDFNFLGVDLGVQPQWNFLWTTNWGNSAVWFPGLILFLIPIISGAAQFLASILNKKMNPVATPEGTPGGGSMQAMLMLMPLFSIYIAFITPAALGFYWTISTVFQIVQDVLLTKIYTKKIDAEEAVKNEERKRKEAEIEAKRIETERKKADGLVERNPNTAKRKKQKSDKQEQLEKATEWEKKNSPPENIEYAPSREGNRRYARGRAYDPARYEKSAEDEAPGTPMLESGDGDEDPESRDRNSGSRSGGEDKAGGEHAEEIPESDDEGEDTSPETVEEDREPESKIRNPEGDPGGIDPNAEDKADETDINPTVRFDTTRFDAPGDDKHS